MRGLLVAKLVGVATVVAAFSGCIESSYEYDDHDRSYAYAEELPPPTYEEAEAMGLCVEMKDPLHLEETRDLAGFNSKTWTWTIPTACVHEYSVTFKVEGLTGQADAVAVCFSLELVDPEGTAVAEMHDWAAVSGQTTVLNWTVGPDAVIVPGQWQLYFSTAGALHYEVEVFADY